MEMQGMYAQQEPFPAPPVIWVGFAYNLLVCRLLRCTVCLITHEKSWSKECVSVLLDWLRDLQQAVRQLSCTS